MVLPAALPVMCVSNKQLSLVCFCPIWYRWLLLAGAEFFDVVDGSPKHFTIVFNAFVFCQVSQTPCQNIVIPCGLL